MASEQKSGAEPPAAPTEEPELSEQEIIGRYRAMRTEIQKTAQKIAELEQDVGEHELVINTLTPMDGERKAFRLIGGILVERTVADVLPDVTHNHENVKKMVDMLTARLAEIEKIANAWQKKYQIRTPQEQAQQQAASGGGSTGVLA